MLANKLSQISSGENCDLIDPKTIPSTSDRFPIVILIGIISQNAIKIKAIPICQSIDTCDFQTT